MNRIAQHSSPFLLSSSRLVLLLHSRRHFATTSVHPSIPQLQHGVSVTGVLTATLRAREQQQEQPLFYDPYAVTLAGPEGEAVLNYFDAVAKQIGKGGGSFLSYFVSPEKMQQALKASVAVRHKFFDDFILSSLTQIRESRAQQRDDKPLQFVNVACGLDARSFRLPWPRNTHVYEIDRPEVLDYKESKLGPTGAMPVCAARHVIAADVVTDNWEEKLAEKGFDSSLPTVWLAEGLVTYLPNAEVTRLLHRMRAMSPQGSFVGADHADKRLYKSDISSALMKQLDELRAPLLSSTDDPEGLMREAGWDNPDIASLGDARAHFGRWPFPVMPWWVPHILAPRHWLMTARATTRGSVGTGR